MNTFYFVTLRYMPDVIRQEFVNIGILIYCPDTAFLGGKINPHNTATQAISSGIMEWVEYLSERLQGEDMETLLDKIMIRDDSSLQFSKVGYGIANNPEAELDTLYAALVI